MKISTAEKNAKKYSFWFSAIILSLAVLILTGCARPNEENVKQMLSRTYQCKWLELGAYEKVESLPGLWSYVLRYKFDLNFVNGEKGAQKFMRGMYNTTPGETDWKKVFENPKAHAYIREGCTPQAQKVIEQVAIHTYIQLNDKKTTTAAIPQSIHINGWAEMSPGRGGWNMDMRRDKVDPKYVLTNPIPKKAIMSAK